MFFDVDAFISEIKQKLHNSNDIGTRIFKRGEQKIGLIFLRSMTNPTLFSEAIYNPIKESKGLIESKDLIQNLIKADDVQVIEKKDIIEKID